MKLRFCKKIIPRCFDYIADDIPHTANVSYTSYDPQIGYKKSYSPRGLYLKHYSMPMIPLWYESYLTEDILISFSPGTNWRIALNFPSKTDEQHRSRDFQAVFVEDEKRTPPTSWFKYPLIYNNRCLTTDGYRSTLSDRDVTIPKSRCSLPKNLRWHVNYVVACISTRLCCWYAKSNAPFMCCRPMSCTNNSYRNPRSTVGSAPPLPMSVNLKE